MTNLWMLSVFIATLFFVCGQICLRKSFETSMITNNLSSLYATACFSMIIGVLGCILMMSLSMYDPISTKQFFINSIRSGFPFLAGVFFFIGNLFWIYSISSQNPLGIIRILMAGWEMFLLLLVGILIFKDNLHWSQLFGSLLIFSGIGSIIYSHSLTS
jgi:multidrug transporter EmrE-like cation transporter